jgi:hypothetical protein
VDSQNEIATPHVDEGKEGFPVLGAFHGLGAMEVLGEFEFTMGSFLVGEDLVGNPCRRETNLFHRLYKPRV